MAEQPSHRSRFPLEGVAGFSARSELGGPTDKERIELAMEALRGAKWLLLLAHQGLDGPQTLQRQAEEVARVLELISNICE
jgi:hypothetical protein